MSTSTQEPAISRNLKSRDCRAEWLVTTDHDGRDGAERTHYAVLHAFHLQGRGYAATINRETAEKWAHGTMRGYMPFSSVRVLTERVARYSAKTFDGFFDRALAELERRRDEPEIAQFFDASFQPS